MTEDPPCVHNVPTNLITNDITLSNESHNSCIIQRINYENLNISNGAITGTKNITIEVPLGYKGYGTKLLHKMRYTYKTTTVAGVGLDFPYFPYIYNSGNWSANGVFITTINDFTQACALNQRLAYSQDHNLNAYETTYDEFNSQTLPIAMANALYKEETYPLLMPFTIPNSEMTLPPGSVWKFQFNVNENNAIYKAIAGYTSADSSAVAPTITLNDMWVEAIFYRDRTDLRETYAVKILEPSIHGRAITSITMSENFPIGFCTPVIVGCFMQTTTLNSISQLTAINLFKVSGMRFLSHSADYGTLIPGETKDGIGSGSISNLQFTVGSLTIPTYPVDNTYGHRGGFSSSMMHGFNRTDKDISGESYDAWFKDLGPLYAFPVVLAEEEQVNHLAVRANFKTAVPPSTDLYVYVHKQRIIKFDYNLSLGKVESVEISA